MVHSGVPMIGSIVGLNSWRDGVSLLAALTVGVVACCSGTALLFKPATNEQFRRWLSLGRRPASIRDYSPAMKAYVRMAGGALALLSGFVVVAVMSRLLELLSRS